MEPWRRTVEHAEVALPGANPPRYWRDMTREISNPGMRAEAAGEMGWLFRPDGASRKFPSFAEWCAIAVWDQVVGKAGSMH